MTIQRLNIPYSVDLTDDSAWSKLEEQDYIYFIVRFHLYIHEYQSEKTTYPGEILASFHTAEKSETETISALEKEHTVTDITETISSQLLSEELLTEVAATINGNLDLLTYQFSGEARSALSHRVHSSVQTSLKSARTVTTKRQERFEIHQKVHAGSDEKIHAVACYKPMAWDIYLHYIDYLVVEYRTTFFGLRKKKRNLPRPIGNRHVNRIKMNLPLAGINYWELLPKSSFLFSESQYQAEKTVSPDEIGFRDELEPISLALPPHPERPTLYTLSNIAFPYRWIDRDGPWTREELIKIEWDEAEGSGWWFRHGPGRSK